MQRRDNSHEQDEHDNHPAEHQRLPADLVQDEPTRERPDEIQSVLAPAQLEGVGVRDARLLVEIGREAADRRAGHGLRKPDEADDLGAPQVDALEAIPVLGALGDLLLHLVRVDHHCTGNILSILDCLWGEIF